jgi:HicA toxin of bacterial toxin-antitoxin,
VLAFIASTWYVQGMNSKQRKVLGDVFADPVKASIAWDDIENLLIACGAVLVEGRGSRVRFEKSGAVESFHRPHPEKEAKRYQVRAAREFLRRMGVNP